MAAADLRWQEMLQAVRAGATPAARLTLAATSEALLELFDRLTREYEQSMQLLRVERGRLWVGTVEGGPSPPGLGARG